MSSLTRLPPEVLMKFFLQLSVDDCLNLAKTCKITAEISKIDIIWEKKMFQDFGIDVKKANCSGPSARCFYQNVLYKYGNLLGLWQVSTLGHYGGLFQVCIDTKYLKSFKIYL